jgi:hypothetical protein
VSIVVALLATTTTVARADSERLVLGTHDAALASALSVAVSPRGLSVVELPETLAAVEDVAIARREIAVPGTVAVVWLCTDAASAPALCFCGSDARLATRPLSVAAPLTPPAAAAVALSVKMLLGPAPPPAPPVPPAPASSSATTAPPPRPPPLAAAPPPRPALPAIALELDVGARLQPVAAQHVGARVGVRAAFAPEAFGRALAVGVGAATGPALAGAGSAAGHRVDDWALALFVRGRLTVAPAWLELDLGPSLHVLDTDTGASKSADLSLDALAGVVVPLGPALVGARVGGFRALTSSSTTAAALPDWNGEALLTVGFAAR